MEPVTHILTGACLARTGLNRRAAYATLTMAIAAEFPDIDTLWSFDGSIAGFAHHRGITHTFLGVPFEAALIVGGVYGFHYFRLARAQRKLAAPTSPHDDHVRIERPLTAAPVRWGLLYGFALLALLSHLLLDYTNNYGLRPFYPFNAHWYAASIVFIFDPLIFALLVGALVIPALLGLVHREVSSQRQAFPGRAWAIAALLAIIGVWTLRQVEHDHAITLALEQSAPAPTTPAAADAPPTDPNAPAPEAPTPTYLPALRVLASPDPLSPFRWYTVADFGAFYQLSEVDTRSNTLQNSHVDLPKPSPTPAILVAEASPLGRVYLDWSPMPIIEAVPSGQPGVTTVIFRDPRFRGPVIPMFHDPNQAPLTGSVDIDSAGHAIHETMDSPTLPDPPSSPRAD